MRSVVRSAWVLSTLPGARAYARALRDPGASQKDVLRRILSSSGDCAFLREHHVGAGTDAKEFRRRVPMRTWEELRPWLDAVVAGTPDVLTRDPVRRLVPTSGTSGGRKLVPTGAALLEDFRRALDPWIWDLHARDPRLLAGSAYWAISPPGDFAPEWNAAHPIGFEDDAAYFGPLARLAEWTRPVPSGVGCLADPDDFRQATLLHLLRCRDLAFVSVWHPSFLELLFDHLEAHWDDLLRDLRTGRTWILPGASGGRLAVPSDPRLSRSLGALGPDPRRLWPGLRQVSAWTDAASAGPARRLRSRLGDVPVVGKGLLATEGVASIPWKGLRPLAVRSHLLEFVDSSGSVGGVEDLAVGGRYELVLTTSGGLWRVRTGDLVEVDGFCEATPCIRFAGRTSGVVDLVGEKLDEASVVAALGTVLPDGEFSLVVPRRDGRAYRLLVESSEFDREALGGEFDRLLRANPHYDLARRLGQLSGIEAVPLEIGSRQRMADLWSQASGGAWSVSKPPVLHASIEWAQRLGAEP
jgi:hypothetical protein